MITERAADLDVSYGRLFLLFLATFLATHFIYKWVIKRPRKLPPGPKGLPILGYWPFLGEESHKTLFKLKEKYGDIFGLYLGNKFAVILNEYSIVKDILNNPASLDRDRDLLRRLEPMGCGTLNGPEWVEQRKFTFHSARALGFGKGPWETIIIEEALSFVKSMDDLCDVPVDISQAVRSSVASNIVNFMTGRKLDKVKDAETIRTILDYAEVAFNYLGPSRTVSVMPWLWNLLVFFKISGYHKVSNIISKFFDFIRQEVSRHKTVPEIREAQDIINSYLHKLEKTSSVKDQQHFFNENNLLGMINSLFLGGSDTIVSSINWLLRLMAQHQDIQKKVHQEIMEVLGKGGIARYEERDAFPYTFAVLMEAQRFSSIAPLGTSRRVNQDFVYNGYEFPKGTLILPNLWALHNDPNYWEAPEKFIPERFLANSGKKLLKTMPSFAPFSIGRRNCPGETIAWMEILAYFTEIIKLFQVSMAPGIKADFSILPGLVSHLKPQLMCFNKRKEVGNN